MDLLQDPMSLFDSQEKHFEKRACVLEILKGTASNPTIALNQFASADASWRGIFVFVFPFKISIVG